MHRILELYHKLWCWVNYVIVFWLRYPPDSSVLRVWWCCFQWLAELWEPLLLCQLGSLKPLKKIPWEAAALLQIRTHTAKSFFLEKLCTSDKHMSEHLAIEELKSSPYFTKLLREQHTQIPQNREQHIHVLFRDSL